MASRIKNQNRLPNLSMIQMDLDNKKVTLVDMSKIYQIEESYRKEDIKKIYMNGKHSEINLHLIDSQDILFNGISSSKPKLVERNVHLEGDFYGYLGLPNFRKAESEEEIFRQDTLELYVESDYGKILGEIIHPGTISIKRGEINLSLFTSRVVDAWDSSSNNLEVKNMFTPYPRPRYYPPTARPISYFKKELKIIAGKEASGEIRLEDTIHSLLIK